MFEFSSNFICTLTTKIYLENVDFNVTGTVLYTADPLNFYVENVTVDTYSRVEAFSMIAQWNYPEAYYQGELVANNLTFITSSVRKFFFRFF